MKKEEVFILKPRVMDYFEATSFSFHRDLDDFLEKNPQIKVVESFEEDDIPLLWVDYCNSMGANTPPKYESWDIVRKGEYDNARILLGSEYKNRVDALFPIEISSRLTLWYFYYAKWYVGNFTAEPTPKEYSYYFTLRNYGNEGLLKLLNYQPINFHSFITKLYTSQAAYRRKRVIRRILSNEEDIERLRTNTFVVSAEDMFILTTSQVYSAYQKRVERGKPLPMRINSNINYNLPRNSSRGLGISRDTRDIFRKAEKLVKSTGISPQEALEKVSKELVN